MLRIVSILVLAAVASATTVTYNPAQFCQRYASALFPVGPTVGSAGDGQYQLIAAVIDRALSGGSGNGFNVTGILNTESQKSFFNGTRTGGTNYYTNTAQRLQLRGKLITFFGCAMGCRDNCTSASAPTANMNTVHASMNIGKEVWNDFINQVALTLYSFGVPSTTDANSETAYVLALMGQFNRNGAQAICTAADCDAATGFAEFTSGTDDSSGSVVNRWLNSATGSYSVSIPVGGKVHWNIGTIHNVVQASDSTFSTPFTGGFTSGAVGATQTFTSAFNTAGTYYFYCNPHKTTMQGTIVVGSTPSGAASTVPAMAMVLAAVIAGFSLSRRI